METTLKMESGHYFMATRGAVALKGVFGIMGLQEKNLGDGITPCLKLGLQKSGSIFYILI